MPVNDIAYIEKTLPKVLDKVFAKESYTDVLLGDSEIALDFLDARTVKIFKLASTGLTNYKRGGHGSTNTRGAVQTQLETYTLSQERYSEIPFDELDNLDDGGTVLAHQAAEFIRTKVVPEFDTYRFSKLAGYTSTTIGNRVEETISENTIIANFNNAFKWLAEQKVPTKDQIIFVSPAVMQLIRNTSELYKKLSQTEYRGDVSFTIATYEGRPIVEVPSDEFYTDAVFDDEGYHPGANSKTINYLIVYRKAPIIVKKLDYAKIFSSTKGDGATYLGFVGYLLTNLYYHDLFVSDNQKVSIYCSVSNETASSNTLLVDAVAGTTAGTTVINSVLTQPAGILWDTLYVSSSNVAIGTTYSGGTQISIGVEFTPGTSNNYIVATRDGVVVAISKDFTTTLPTA